MLCSPEQRRYLIQIAAPKQRLELMNISNVTIVKLSEIQEILNGNEKKYRSCPPKPLIKGETVSFPKMPIPAGVKRNDSRSRLKVTATATATPSHHHQAPSQISQVTIAHKK